MFRLCFKIGEKLFLRAIHSFIHFMISFVVLSDSNKLIKITENEEYSCMQKGLNVNFVVEIIDVFKNPLLHTSIVSKYKIFLNYDSK